MRLAGALIGALIIVVAAILAAASTSAATVKLSDAQRVVALWKKANILGGDISQTGQSITDAALSNATSMSGSQILEANLASACFLRLSRAADGLEGFLHVAAVTLLVASDMKDQRDDASALKVARASLSGTNLHLAAARQITNSVAGACRNSAAVNVKAQAILDLIDEIDRQIAPIAQRVGASPS